MVCRIPWRQRAHLCPTCLTPAVATSIAIPAHDDCPTAHCRASPLYAPLYAPFHSPASAANHQLLCYPCRALAGLAGCKRLLWSRSQHIYLQHG